MRLRKWARGLLAVLLLCVFMAGNASAVPLSPKRQLTTVRQVHALSAEEAAKHPSIHMRGVVTSNSVWPKTFFFQDETGGIAVGNQTLTNTVSGQRVEMAGEAAPGLFAPVIHAHTIRVLGTAAMPRSRLFTSQELLGGGQDGRWIAIQGVVQSARVTTVHGTSVLSMTVEVNGNKIEAYFLRYNVSDAAQWIDATVRLTGVCTTSFNDKQQFTGISLQVPFLADVRIEKAGPTDPYALPTVPVRSLLQYRPGFRFEHRLQIVGTVTYQDLGHSLYLQDGKDGVLLATEQRTAVALGTKIAAVGFASPGDYSPVLREGSFRVIGVGTAIAPIPIRGQDMLRKDYFVTAPYDAQLVQLTGRLVETRSRLNDVLWIFRDGDSQFTAVLQRTPGSPDPAAVEIGSVVAVTGVFTTQLDENYRPNSFSVLLRNAGDLIVIKRAPWWNMGHTMDLLLMVLVVAFATTLWGATLRRTVRQQTQMLRESEERFRNQAQHDALTGLVSRSFLHEQLQETIRAARFSGEKFGLLMVDLDFFKQVNDTLGHHAGDELLCLVANRLRAAVRKTDTVARMGGDEFVVLLSNLSGMDEAEEIGAKVVASISAPAEIAGRPMLISASVGVCLYPDGGKDAETLFQNVDTAMYKAKTGGRNSFSIHLAERTERMAVGLPILSHTHS